MKAQTFFTTTRYLLSAASATVVLSLTACGGGSGTGGGSQSPDAVVVDIPIAYVRRPLPVDDNGDRIADDPLDPATFSGGAELIIRERAAGDAAETIITDGVFDDADPDDDLPAQYDVKDLSVSSDGEKLLFAMRAPEIPNADDDEQPRWNIWEYDIPTTTLRRVMASDNTAETGDDISPSYLPDGRIVFTSDRQRRTRALLLDDNKPQYSGLTEDFDDPAFVLHVMEADGTNIQQLTYNQSHDLQPAVMSDGHIVFNRWDNLANNRLSLYSVRPDGQEMSFLYGYHSQNTGTNDSAAIFHQPQQLPDGRLLAILRPQQTDQLGGDIIAIDKDNFTEIDRAIDNLPDDGNGGAVSTEPGQVALSLAAVATDDTISRHGYFSSASPLFDGTNRLLVSWTDCRLTHPTTGNIIPCTDSNLAIANITEAPPLYGLWIYDLDAQTQQPLFSGEEGLMYSEVISLSSRPNDTFLADRVGGVDLDQTRVDNNEATLHIRSVYDVDGVDVTGNLAALADPAQTTNADRPAQFLRLEKAVSIPDDDTLDFDNSAFGVSRAQGMREILGYAPIEPDGSVKLVVPADVALTFSVVDSQGRRISARHQNWLQLRPGETRECSGCHSRNSLISHGRPGAAPSSANPGALNNAAFPNTDPILSASIGETMAETWASLVAPRTPTVDMIYNDDWTDPLVRAKDAPYAINYSDLQTPIPATNACLSSWSSQCRVIINYPTHIQPLWELTREITDGMGNVLEDRTCTSCHNTRDAANALMVPAGQLDLTSTPSTDEPDHLTSYRELLAGDNEQEIVDGALIDRLVESGSFQTDADGNLVLDTNGDPIPILVTVPISAPASTAGARVSRFFDVFDAGGSHAGYLSDAELKLIAEWLDIGGQYYNNPFDVPVN